MLTRGSEFQSQASIKLFTWILIVTMGIQDKNKKNSIESKNYPKIKILRELEKFDIDWLVYCYKAKCTVQWAEEHITKDVFWLNSITYLHYWYSDWVLTCMAFQSVSSRRLLFIPEILIQKNWKVGTAMENCQKVDFVLHLKGCNRYHWCISYVYGRNKYFYVVVFSN